MIRAQGIEPMGGFGFDAVPVVEPAEAKLTVIRTPDAARWEQVHHTILQHEKAAVDTHYARRIVKVTAPDVPGRPDFADGVYGGFSVEHGSELILHFNDGTQVKP